MAASRQSADDTSLVDSELVHRALAGEKVAFIGKLVGMTRPEACELVEAHGGQIATDETGSATLVVLGDNRSDLQEVVDPNNAAHMRWQDDVAAGRAQLWRESQLWQQAGLVEDQHEASQSVHRLYTPAMLADLLDVPVAAIRRWHRQGTLVACRHVRRLPYFDFAEVAIARHLASLLTAGCSLRVIDRKLEELHRSMPEIARPLADPAIVVSGRCLYCRRGEELAEPGGQLLIDFDKPISDEEEPQPLISFSSVLERDSQDSSDGALAFLDRMQEEALAWEDQGDLQQAAEMYRTMLVAEGPVAETQFALADLLYRMGDLPAARERFYAAIELDEEYVEARSNLGCVLAENNELELAVAAFQGALSYHSDYVDVHYHLANVLDRLGRQDEAERHWRSFIGLAPESPWAETARARLGDIEGISGVVVAEHNLAEMAQEAEAGEQRFEE